MSIPVWLQELKDAEAKATPGPWESSLDVLVVRVENPQVPLREIGRTCGEPFKRWDDARLIALARSELPRLLAIAEAAADIYEHADDLTEHEHRCQECDYAGTRCAEWEKIHSADVERYGKLNVAMHGEARGGYV